MNDVPKYVLNKRNILHRVEGVKDAWVDRKGLVRFDLVLNCPHGYATNASLSQLHDELPPHRESYSFCVTCFGITKERIAEVLEGIGAALAKAGSPA